MRNVALLKVNEMKPIQSRTTHAGNPQMDSLSERESPRMKNFEQARTLDFCNLKSVLYRGCGRIHVRQDNTQVGELADNG